MFAGLKKYERNIQIVSRGQIGSSAFHVHTTVLHRLFEDRYSGDYFIVRAHQQHRNRIHSCAPSRIVASPRIRESTYLCGALIRRTKKNTLILCVCVCRGLWHRGVGSLFVEEFEERLGMGLFF